MSYNESKRDDVDLQLVIGIAEAYARSLARRNPPTAEQREEGDFIYGAVNRLENQWRQKEREIAALRDLVVRYLPVCVGDCGCDGANAGCELLTEKDGEMVASICADLEDE